MSDAFEHAASGFEDCIRCGLCRSGSPSFRAHRPEPVTAKGRNILLMASATPAELEEVLWDCSSCGYCDAVCPKEIHNTRVMEVARARVIALRGPPRTLTEALDRVTARGNPFPAGDAQSPPARLRSPSARCAPGLPLRSRTGPRAGRLLFLGCAARAAGVDPDAVLAVSGPADILPDEGCCGALFAEAGWDEGANRARGDLADRVRRYREVIAASAPCARALRELGARVTPLAERLFVSRLAPSLRPSDLLVAPCRLVNLPRNVRSPTRDAALALAAETGAATNLGSARLASCCGADPLGLAPGGADRRDVWKDLVFGRRVERLVVACGLCALHLREAADVPVAHAADLGRLAAK